MGGGQSSYIVLFLEPAPDPSIIQIQVVAEDVNKKKEEIKSLHSVADTLDYDQLSRDPEGRETLRKLQKQCLQYTHTLMQDLLKLDEIVASQDARPLRKKQVMIVCCL